MACDQTRIIVVDRTVVGGRRQQTPEERLAQVTAALAELERLIKSGDVMVIIDKVTGAIAFKGWKENSSLSDACAYRLLMAKQSWPLRQAIARAEHLAGRKVNEKAVAAGVHSHDGGKTWGPGH